MFMYNLRHISRYLCFLWKPARFRVELSPLQKALFTLFRGALLAGGVFLRQFFCQPASFFRFLV